MKKLSFVRMVPLTLVISIALSVVAFAHPGRLNSEGGHYSVDGVYHYHRGNDRSIEYDEPRDMSVPLKPENYVKLDKFDEQIVIEQIEVDEYKWIYESSSKKYRYIALILKNNSDFDISVEVKLLLKDANGALVGAKKEEEYAFEAGFEVPFVFFTEDDYDSYEYELFIKEENRYRCVLSSLTYEINTIKDKAVIAVVNEGDISAQYAKCTCLFFKGNDVVDWNYGFPTDSDSEIKPNKTEYAEISSRKEFDSIKLYLTGRAKK